MSLDPIKGAEHLLIAQSGFSSKDSFDIERLIQMMGADQAKEDQVSSSSYLICCKPEGHDYETARENNVFTVNKQWIEQCVTEWDIVSIDRYVSWPRELKATKKNSSRRYRTPSKNDIDMNRGRTGCSTEIKARNELKENRKRSTEPRNICERCTKTSAAPSCRKRLGFNWKCLSDYSKSDLLVKVQVPCSRLQIAIGTDVIKSALLRSYESLANFHSDGQCIANEFSAKNFQVSLNSGQVRIEFVQRVSFTQELAKSNKAAFVMIVRELYRENSLPVPDDIAGWLSSIADKVPDRVLTRHINMLDPNEIFGGFMGMYYLLLRLRRKDTFAYNNIVGSEEMRSYINWQKHGVSWICLYESLHYIHPRQLELERLKRRMHIGGSAQTICKPKAREPNVFGLLELIRDCFFHPALDYQEFLLPILLTQYPDLLSKLQSLLVSLGLLKYVN